MTAHDKINEGTVQRERRFLKRIDGRYVIPDGIEVEKVVATERVPDDMGSTGNWHYEYVCVVREVDA